MSVQEKFRLRLYIAQVMQYVRDTMAAAFDAPEPDMMLLHEVRATLIEARAAWKALR